MIKNILTYQLPKCLALLATIGIFTWDRCLGVTHADSKATWFIGVLAIMQAVNLWWTEGYRYKLWKQDYELKVWRNR